MHIINKGGCKAPFVYYIDMNNVNKNGCVVNHFCFEVLYRYENER